MKSILRRIILGGVGFLFPLVSFAQSAVFTYQGQLRVGTGLANGTYDLSVSICTAASGGVTSIPIYVDDLVVTDGLFTAELDFGTSYFDGSDRWLEIGVRPGSASNADRSGYTLLVPRQKITAGPYALFSRDSARLGGQTPDSFAPASHAHSADSIISGELPDARVSNTLTISDSGSVDGGAIKTGTISQARIDSAVARDSEVSNEIDIHSSYSDAHHTWPLTDAEIPNDITISSSGSVDGGGIKSGTVADTRIASTITRDNEVMTIVLANDGTGSGLDADRLDGQHASAFMPAETDNWVNTTGDAMTGILNIEGAEGWLTVKKTSNGGSAIRGEVSNTDALSNQYGGYFENKGKPGAAVYAYASVATGRVYAVHGKVNSASGYAAFFEGPEGSANYFQRSVGIGNGSPPAPLFVQSVNNWSYTEGTGWGDFSIGLDQTGGTSDYGLCFGVATSGGGAGTARIWTKNAKSLIFANTSGGDVLYVLSDKVGVKRSPLTNALEVGGTASKTTAGDWLANSDARIKTNIRTVSSALDTLARVRLVEFEYTEEYLAEHPEIEDRRYMNVIAQEFAEVFPDYVQGSGETLPDGEEILQVDTHPLTIYSAAAVQELHAEITRLREQNRQMEERLSRLESVLLSGNAK